MYTIVFGGVKLSGLGLVTSSFHSSKRPKSPQTQGNQIRLTRIEDGRKEVELSSAAERAFILKRFAEESCQTPSRLQIYNATIEKEKADEVDHHGDEEMTDLDARFDRDMNMAIKLSLEHD